jgi:hypothetical protein
MEACEEWRASGCSAEPNEDWLIGGVVLRGEEDIVDRFSSLGDAEDDEACMCWGLPE